MNEHIDSKMLQTYYKQIKKALPMYAQSEKKFLREFQKSAEDFVRKHPDGTFTDLLNHLGTPDQVSQRYLSSLEPQDLYRRIICRIRIKRILILITVLAAVAFCFYLAFLYDIYSHCNGYFVNEIIVYE